jgi:hypothetical protein
MSKESTYSSPAMQTVKRGVKVALAHSRKQFDASPSAANWQCMLVWSLVWQQIRSWRGMDAALKLHFERSVPAGTAAFASDLLLMLFPGQSLSDLIRS